MRMFTAILFLVSAAAFGDTPPPPPVQTPEEQLESFVFAEPGYRIELVASEPMVQDPVMISFDGEGRLWVVEMRGYMQDIDRKGVHDQIGRVSVLEDTNRDGVMDQSTVFLDNLVLPRSIAIHPDGVLIAENIPLWFVEDTDGDLVADRKTSVDPDYANDDLEHSSNGLLRAMDNWIYNAKEGHRYRRTNAKWIREETEPRGQWGICQDDRGRLFYNYNHSQLHADLVPPNTLGRNPNHEPSTGLGIGVTSNNTVFPVRPNLATNRGYIPGALDEQGRIRQFTSACAPFVYRETLFPEFSGNAFVCETAGNLVTRNILAESGLRITGTPAYPDRDFLASTDERFRPCWIATGPDGAIYIADMYRGIVQDGPHMSPYLREHSIARKMDQPIHLGRIWRIVPENFVQPERPCFSKMTGGELVDQLANSSGWWRDQAQMHLVEKNIVVAIPALRKMALEHDNPTARLHALWTLEGLGDPEPETLTEALNDELPVVQASAFRVLKTLGVPHSKLARKIVDLTSDSLSGELALQMILTLGDLEIDAADRYSLLERLLLPRINDPLIRDAALSSLARREVAFLQSLWPNLKESHAADLGVSFLIESLSQAITKSRNPGDLFALLAMLDSAVPDWKQQSVLTGMGLFAEDLIRDPVALAKQPHSAQYYDQFARFFAWPGHVPEPPAKTSVRPLKKSERELFARGRQIFLTSCVACHGPDGMGMKFLAPPLAGSDWVTGSEERLARVLFHGLTGPITVKGKRYDTPEVQPVMPPLATLGNNEIAAVLTYIRREWGNMADPISPGEINQLRIRAQGRTVPWTEEELRPYTSPDKSGKPL